MAPVRSMAALVLLLAAGAAATAQVVRCEDAAGRVSYNDTGCQPGARRSELDLPAAPAVRPARDAVDEAAAPRPPAQGQEQAPTPGRAIILDSRAGSRSGPDADADADAPYAPYPYDGSRVRQNAQPQDMRPRIRGCGPSGCQDTQGNHYDRAGKLDRYVRPDGRTCSPVGTTVVCR